MSPIAASTKVLLKLIFFCIVKKNYCAVGAIVKLQNYSITEIVPQEGKIRYLITKSKLQDKIIHKINKGALKV